MYVVFLLQFDIIIGSLHCTVIRMTQNNLFILLDSGIRILNNYTCKIVKLTIQYNRIKYSRCRLWFYVFDTNVEVKKHITKLPSQLSVGKHLSKPIRWF